MWRLPRSIPRMTLGAGLSLLILGLPSFAARAVSDHPESRTGVSKAGPPRTPEVIAGRPFAWFEPNDGQVAPEVRFLARTPALTAFFTDRETVFVSPDGATVRMTASTGDGTPTFRGDDPLPGRSNYFLGNDPGLWVTEVPHYGELLVGDSSTGVALHWRTDDRGRLRYDVELPAGVDPSTVRLRFEGADRVSVDPAGVLRLDLGGGAALTHSPPRAYQEVRGLRRPVASSFLVRSDRSVGFEVEDFDPGLPLVIDPSVQFSGGIGRRTGTVSYGYGAAIDDDGNVFMAGYTNNSNFPTENAYQSARRGAEDAFVLKMTPDGQTLLYSTYFGGSGQELCNGLALGSDGSVCIVGTTVSTNLPIKNASQDTFAGIIDGFVAKIGPTGSTLTYSTYVGGSSNDSPNAVALGADGSAWVTGRTGSTNFPTASAEQSSNAGSTDAFLLKVPSSGGDFAVSTYLGGTLGEAAYGIAVDPDGRPWVVGMTGTTDFPVQSPIQEFAGGGIDAFLVAYSSAGTTRVFSSYFGGSDTDEGLAIAIDQNGKVCITGRTLSTNLPTTDPLQGSNAGGYDVFLWKVDGADFTTEWSTYLGGSSTEYGNAVGVDGNGDVYVAGRTLSTNFPLEEEVQGTLAGNLDFFLTKVDSGGTTLLFSTYFGGQDEDEPHSLATDGSSVVIAGHTRSSDFPTVNPYGSQSTPSNVDAAFVKIRISPPGPTDFSAVEILSSAVTLEWVDAAAGGVDYHLERRVGTGDFEALADLSPGTTSYEDTDVTEATSYEYRLRGTADIGGTEYVTETVLTPPTSPQDLTAQTVTDRRIDLAWTDLSEVETGFEVDRRNDDAEEGDFELLTTLPANAVSHSDETASQETTYTYRVRAVDGSGSVENGNEASATTAPAAPVLLSGDPFHDTRVDLRWVDRSSAEEGFEVERMPAGGTWEPAGTPAADATSYSDGGVLGETTYSYRIRAVNVHGASEWAPTSAAVTTPPRAPLTVEGQPLSPNEAIITWDDDSGVEEGFRIDRSEPGSIAFVTAGTVGPNVTTLSVPDLFQETPYTFRVLAFDANGNSRSTASEPVTTPSQLVILRAKVSPATAKKAARAQIQASVDPGALGLDPAGGIILGANGAEYALGPFVPLKKGKILRHQGAGMLVDLLPASSGASEVGLKIDLEGDPASSLIDQETLTLSFTNGAYGATGTARLAGGQFHAKKGVGSWVNPPLHLLSFSAGLKGPGKDSVKLSAAFPPDDPIPGPPPTVSLSVTDGFTLDFNPASFRPKGAGFSIVEKLDGNWKGKIDYAKGTVSLKGTRLDLGPFPDGPVSVKISLRMGDRWFVDSPVLVRTGKKLKR